MLIVPECALVSLVSVGQDCVSEPVSSRIILFADIKEAGMCLRGKGGFGGSG